MTYTLDEVIEMAERTDKLIERSEFHKDATEYLKQYREMRWHYPSKGEYPTENGKYLVIWRGEYGEHVDLDKWCNGEWLYIDEVVAWQYIIAPKEEA